MQRCTEAALLGLGRHKQQRGLLFPNFSSASENKLQSTLQIRKWQRVEITFVHLRFSSHHLSLSDSGPVSLPAHLPNSYLHKEPPPRATESMASMTLPLRGPLANTSGSPHLGNMIHPPMPPSCIMEELQRAFASKNRQERWDPGLTPYILCLRKPPHSEALGRWKKRYFVLFKIVFDRIWWWLKWSLLSNLQFLTIQFLTNEKKIYFLKSGCLSHLHPRPSSFTLRLSPQRPWGVWAGLTPAAVVLRRASLPLLQLREPAHAIFCGRLRGRQRVWLAQEGGRGEQGERAAGPVLLQQLRPPQRPGRLEWLRHLRWVAELDRVWIKVLPVNIWTFEQSFIFVLGSALYVLNLKCNN